MPVGDASPGGGALPRLKRRLSKKAKKLKRQLMSLFLAWKDPGTPLAARLVIACTIGYALSPIDLIPDFIPVLGYLDDLVILPALVILAIRLIPPAVMARARREAWRREASGERVKSPAGRVAAILFILLWAGLAALILFIILGRGA
jgi:uncharacterized membrane protein YkvA (DUF1232 family)